MKKKTINVIIIIILIISAAFCAGMMIRQLVLHNTAGQVYEELKEEVKTASVPEETPSPEPEATEKPTVKPSMTPNPTEAAASSSSSEEEKEPIEVPIDFETLQKRNPDAYAWITIENTKVDYPILQGEDNSFYVHHDIDRNYNFAGCLFTEDYNSKDFEDPMTVIYGHNMHNESMFGTLYYYTDMPGFFENNKDITVYMPDKILHYRVFAAYQRDDEHLLHNRAYDNPSSFQLYLDSVLSLREIGAKIDRDIELDAETDKILTLSTCVGDGSSGRRYLVQAVLVSIEE